jgi:hypothetical protein
MGDNKDSDGISICEVEDVVHNLLLVVLQHSMRKKDGWKVRYFGICFYQKVTYFIEPNFLFAVSSAWDHSLLFEILLCCSLILFVMWQYFRT